MAMNYFVFESFWWFQTTFFELWTFEIQNTNSNINKEKGIWMPLSQCHSHVTEIRHECKEVVTSKVANNMTSLSAKELN